MWLIVLLLTLVRAAGVRYLYVNARPDGFNNQMNQVWYNLYLARRYNRTAAVTDLWPSWSTDKKNSSRHFAFTKYFRVDQAVVRTVSIETLREACPNGLSFYGDFAWQWWKVDLQRIGHTRATDVYASIDNWVERAPECAGLNTVARIDDLGEPHLSYYHSARRGPEDWLAVRRATEWSTNFITAAAELLRRLSVSRYAALHVRRGDYLASHCPNFRAFQLSERRFACPSDDDIVGVIADKIPLGLDVVILTNDAKLAPNVRKKLPGRNIVATNDAGSHYVDYLHKFGIENSELGIVEQVVGTFAEIFIGVSISSFTGTIMSGRDVNHVPYNCTLTWQSVFTRQRIECQWSAPKLSK